MATLFSAKNQCLANPDRQSCQRNFSAETSNELTFSGNATGLAEGITRNDNLYVSQWYGDDGTNRELDVINGIRSVGSDLLYATQTERNAFAAYTQGVWDISETSHSPLVFATHMMRYWPRKIYSGTRKATHYLASCPLLDSPATRCTKPTKLMVALKWMLTARLLQTNTAS